MTSILVFLACMALVLAAEEAPQTLVDSIVIEAPYEFDLNKWAINRSLEGSLTEINRLLFNKIPKDKTPSKHIEAAKEILRESSSSPTRHGSISEQIFRKALKTFIALERTEGRCTWKSYLILAENYVASENHLGRAMDRVYSVIDHYLRLHAQRCRPYYRAKFKEFLSTMEGSEDLRKIQLILSTISTLITDFSVIVSGKFELSERILGLLMDRIAFMMRENSDLQQRKLIIDHSNSSVGSQAKPVSMASILEKYLIGPCENYRNHFRAILVPARLVAAVEDDDQWEFLTHDDEDHFTTGLKNYIICNSLLENYRSNNNQYLVNVMQDALDKLE